MSRDFTSNAKERFLLHFLVINPESCRNFFVSESIEILLREKINSDLDCTKERLEYSLF